MEARETVAKRDVAFCNRGLARRERGLDGLCGGDSGGGLVVTQGDLEGEAGAVARALAGRAEASAHLDRCVGAGVEPEAAAVVTLGREAMGEDAVEVLLGDADAVVADDEADRAIF